jgi:hypothetical protein
MQQHQQRHICPPTRARSPLLAPCSSSGQDDADNVLLRSLESEGQEGAAADGSGKTAVFAGLGLLGGLALLLGGGYVFR